MEETFASKGLMSSKSASRQQKRTLIEKTSARETSSLQVAKPDSGEV